MQRDELVSRGEHILTVCNACRYCERFCPVFPALERRRTFAAVDLAYLANLCHNCGECLYACQYAPPHEFAVNVPRTLAELRLRSYEEYAWPRALGAIFRRNSVSATLVLAVVLAVLLLAVVATGNPDAVWRARPQGDFYGVLPHGAMVALFGAAFGYAVVAVVIAVKRFLHDTGTPLRALCLAAPLEAALTLRHLHANGADCVSGEEQRRPWRRRWHHLTVAGFALCGASTSVAAAYHSLGWRAPYPPGSVPVVLGSLGGLALIAGPIGLWALRRRRDPLLGDPAQRGLDEGFLALLLVVSATGLALLLLRNTAWMSAVLAAHLGAVLAIFMTFPYGKFVHGLFRLAALAVDARERGHDSTGAAS